MRAIHIYCITLIWLIPQPSASQSKEEEILFEYAVDLYQSEEYQEAADSFDSFLRNFPYSPLKGRAHFNLGLCFKSLGDIARAKATFREILEMPYNEKDGNSLMEPYALYKHHSCRILAIVALDEQNYKEAQHYIRLFDKKFPYRHFCGNEWAAYNMFKAVMTARAHAGMNRPQEAIETLVPYTFSSALASNEEVLEALETILSKTFTKEDIKAELLRGIESIKVKQRGDRTKGEITLFNVSVEIENYEVSDEPTLEHYRRTVKLNRLFKKYLSF